MAGRKSDLYRWDKFSKPRVYSRTQKVTTNNDIHDWIKKVEEASDNAAAAAFGRSTVLSKRAGHREAQVKVEDAHLHDAAYAEAHDLLQEWVTEKLDLDDGALHFESEPWAASSGRHKKSAVDIKREWDNMVATNDDDCGLGSDSVCSPVSASERSKEVYSWLLADDAETTVDGILQAMLQKEVVSERMTHDLGLDIDTRHTDPTTRMAVRHQQVKENRLKREAERKLKLQEVQARKEAQLTAKRTIKKEEAANDAKRKREEAEIQHEMAQIRKEMAEEQKRNDEQKRRERLENEKRDLEEAAEIDRQQRVEAEARKYLAMEDVDRQRRIAHKIQQAEAKNATVRLRLLHRYFSAWYGVVADRRIQLGKARAMSDWKLLLRVWRGWRAYTVMQHSRQDTQRHFEEVKERQRKQTRAENHYRATTMRRCLAAWLLFMGLERKQREVQREQKVTKNKMAAFLQAAASGSLWSKEKGNNLRKSISLDDVNMAGTTQSTACQKVEDMFSQPARPRRGSSSVRSVSTSHSTITDKTEMPGNRPTQAWQITRKHVQLTQEEIAKLTQGQSEGSDTSRPNSSRSTVPHRGHKPWEKKYVVNTTEHRTAAQAKILEHQQTQIKEQQRLIEELTYLQKQQMLQTQLTRQQLLQQQLNGGGGATVAAPNEEQTKLEKHLQELQASLVQHGAGMPHQPGNRENARTETTSVPVDNNRPKTKLTGRSQHATNKMEHLDAIEHTERETIGSKTNRSDVSRTTAGLSTGRTISSSNSKHTDFIKAMEDRAADRARLKAEREAKRRKAEEERLVRLAAEAEEAHLQEEEEKRQRADEYRERKRLEKQRELERQREAERVQELYTMAEMHNQRALIKFCGWRPWRRLVEIARNRRIVADEHHQTQLKRKVLIGWKAVVHEEVEHKEGLADHMLRYILLRRCLNNWRRIGECVLIQEVKARRFFTSHLVARVFTAWRNYIEEEKIATWQKERKARQHNLYRMKKKTFSALRRFPRVRRADEERERRRADMRKKVASMLTDYEGQQKSRESNESDISEFFS